MSHSELLIKHRESCRECQTGFCTPATFLAILAGEPVPTTVTEGA